MNRRNFSKAIAVIAASLLGRKFAEATPGSGERINLSEESHSFLPQDKPFISGGNFKFWWKEYSGVLAENESRARYNFIFYTSDGYRRGKGFSLRKLSEQNTKSEKAYKTYRLSKEFIMDYLHDVKGLRGRELREVLATDQQYWLENALDFERVS